MIEEIIKENEPPCTDKNNLLDIMLFPNNPTVFCHYSPAMEQQEICAYLTAGDKYFECKFYNYCAIYSELLK